MLGKIERPLAQNSSVRIHRSDNGGSNWVPGVKLFYDKIVSAVALVSLLPFICVIALAIRLTSRGPVFYSHPRLGKDGKTFACLKFRTMVPDADARLQALIESDPEARAKWHEFRKLDPDPRITPLGAFLRRSSLDELPQFWNVLRGDMSIVGPRPISVDEADQYAEHLMTYFTVRPGITGVWQVSGRSNTSYAERVRMDVEYIKGWSFWLDLQLTARTFQAVLAAHGAR
ncbi:MAG: sugar transferase [Rhodobacteraceae bacterium]|nr:sugar transferase [Paracoccaceae bacterium]